MSQEYPGQLRGTGAGNDAGEPAGPCDPVQPKTEGRSLRQQAAGAAMASGASEIVSRALAIVLSIVTARILEPREVGVLGLAVILIGVVSLITACPEVAAVTAKGEEPDTEFALVGSIIRAVAVATLLAILTLGFQAIAPYLVKDLGTGRDLWRVLLVLYWVPIVEMTSTYPRVMLQRTLHLRYLAMVQMVQPVAFVGLSILFLLKGYGFLGICWANALGTAVAVLLTWVAFFSEDGRLTRRFSKSALRQTVSGSTRVFTGSFGGYVGARLDNLLVAGCLGPTAMSFYSMGWNASRVLPSVLARAIDFVLVPTFARIQADTERVERALGECLRYSYLILVPVCGAAFVFAAPVVSFVLGAKWLPLVPAFRVMCLTVLIDPLMHTATALLVGWGRAQYPGISAAVRIIVLVVTMGPLCYRYGLIGAAYSDLVSALALTIALYATVRLRIRAVKWRFASALAIPVAAAGACVLLAWGARFVIPEGAPVAALQLSVLLFGYPVLIIAFGGKNSLVGLVSLIRGMWVRGALAAAN
jgi:O-antigen/teichoic acid export membrane protein